MDEPQGDDASSRTGERTMSEEVLPPSTSGHGHSPSGYSSTGRSGSGRRYEREPRVENLIDGVMGGSSSTTLDRPEVHAPSSARTPMAWPPRPTVTPPPLFPSSAPTSAPVTAPVTGAPQIAAPQPAASTRAGERLHRPGNWTHRGLRRRWHIALALVVAGAMIAAAVITTQSLDASASTNFPGVLSSTSAEYFNFLNQGSLTSVDVVAGETVAAGQILATQYNVPQAEAVVRDNVDFASDAQALAALLGTSGQAAEAQAGLLLTKAQSISSADEQHGSATLAQGEAKVGSADAQQTAASGQLAADQTSFSSQCPTGAGPGCAGLARAITRDKAAVALAEARVAAAQSNLSRDEGINTTLNQLANEVLQAANSDHLVVLPAIVVEIRLARAAVANDEYQLSVDEAALAATNLVAPQAGTVLAVFGVPGEIVGDLGTHGGSTNGSSVVPNGSSSSNETLTPSSPTSASAAASQPLISIDAAGIEAVAQVPEAQIASVFVGEKAVVTVNALKGDTATLLGKVASINLQPVVVTGAVYYNVTVVPASGAWSGKLFPGMTTNVAIP